MLVERVGLVGAGGIAPVHAEAWRSLRRKVSVYSLDGASRLAKAYGFEVADSPEDLFASVDLVDVVTPSTSHCGIVVAALEAGRPVICEKPLGATASDAVAIIEAAEAANLPVFPAHVVRYFPDYYRTKLELEAGRVGRVAIARWWRHGEAPPAGSWFHGADTGGGIVRDLMIHDLDQAVWALGDVVTVYGVQAESADMGAPTAVAHAVLTHGSGAISQVTASWGPRGTTFRTGFAVFGADGMLRHDSDRDGLYATDLPGEHLASGYIPPKTRAESPYTTELRSFIDVLEGREQRARVRAEDGFAAVALAEAVMQSIQEGQPVQVVSPIAASVSKVELV